MRKEPKFLSFSLPMLLFVGGCLLGAQSPLSAQVSEQMPTMPTDKTVITMTVEELHQYYPQAVRNLEFSFDQDQLAFLLAKIGERVQVFFRDFANTSSKEYVLMQRLGYNGVADAQDSRDFNYLMIYHPSENKPFLEEFRTDKKGRPISQEEMKGFIATSGYACLSLNFHPSYLNASRFRYLGKQISDARAHIIAFAQEPNRDGLLISYAASRSDKPARFAVQGIAWIDPGSYQILRLLINILPEGNHTPLTEQTTDIQFSEMSFSDSQKPMWLPREVVVTTKLSGVRFRTLHRYSDHHLFAVTSDYKIDRPKSKD